MTNTPEVADLPDPAPRPQSPYSIPTVWEMSQAISILVEDVVWTLATSAPSRVLRDVTPDMEIGTAALGQIRGAAFELLVGDQVFTVTVTEKEGGVVRG